MAQEFARRTAFGVLDGLATECTKETTERLVTFLWDQDLTIAAAAACRLAMLLRQERVRQWIMSSAPAEREQPGERADWAWSRFDVQPVLGRVAGRVVYLLSCAPDESVPHEVWTDPDPCLALPALVLRARDVAALMPSDNSVSHASRDPVHLVVHSLTTAQQEALRNALAEGKFRAETRSGFGEVLKSADTPPVIRYLLVSLPADVQTGLAAGLKYGRVPTPDDWVALLDRDAGLTPTRTKGEVVIAGILVVIVAGMAMPAAPWASVAIVLAGGYFVAKIWKAHTRGEAAATNPLRALEAFVRNAQHETQSTTGRPN